MSLNQEDASFEGPGYQVVAHKQRSHLDQNFSPLSSKPLQQRKPKLALANQAEESWQLQEEESWQLQEEQSWQLQQR